jgi:hypothetical protein
MEDKTDWIELRQHWRPRWLSSIQQFSDIETQREQWLNPTNTNPHWSFIEYMCCYFDDIGLSDTDIGYEGWIFRGLATREEVEAVQRFHALASAYNSPNGDDYDDRAVLADPQWHNVVVAAKAAQQKLAEILTDPEELKLLLEP